MIIRFTLHPELDADLISHIQLKAGRASRSKAAKILMRNWYYAECDRKTSPKRHESDSEVTNQDDDFNGLDAIFSKL